MQKNFRIINSIFTFASITIFALACDPTPPTSSKLPLHALILEPGCFVPLTQAPDQSDITIRENVVLTDYDPSDLQEWVRVKSHLVGFNRVKALVDEAPFAEEWYGENENRGLSKCTVCPHYKLHQKAIVPPQSVFCRKVAYLTFLRRSTHTHGC